MAINLDNLIIDRAISGSMMDKSTGEAFYSLNQIKDPSLECTGETVYSVDAVGIKVAAFDRSKEAKLTGSNAFINLGLAAAQFGSDKTVASAESTILVPVRKVITATVTSGSLDTVTLTDVPATGYEPAYITKLTSDGGLGESYVKAVTASATAFAIAEGVVTLPTGTTAGEKFVVLYKKASESAVRIENKADCFAKGGEFWLEVLFVDPCNTNTKYHGFAVFPNAKMSNETTIDFNNEATHGFTIEAMQDYCDDDKKLFYIVVSE